MSSPFFSIVTPVYKPRPDHLAETIDSVRSQSYRDWEWILVDDASGDADVLKVLRDAATTDPRITVIERETNGHIVAASNDGLARATGEWIVLLDHDDLLLPDALDEVHQAIASHPRAGYIYTDEDKIDDDGNLSGEFCKPDWSPERLRHQMYLGHLSVLRHDLVRAVGGFHPGFDGSQDHDLALRVTERCDDVVHIPRTLYHWRMVPGSAAGDVSAKDYATVAGIKAVQEHLKRIGLDSVMTVEPHPQIAHTYDLHRNLSPDTLISVIIPTRGTAGMVWGTHRIFVVEAVRSLLARTSHHALEIVVVYDIDTPNHVLSQLRHIAGPHLTEVPYNAPFNFSDKCNRGFLAASGEIVVFLNDDMEIVSEHFIEELCAPLIESDVAATGAHLLYEDTTVQHAGLVFQEGEFMHAYLGARKEDPGYFAELCVDHEVSGLTGAAIAVRRGDFEEAGGFCDLLPSNFNDVDFAFKLRRNNRRLLWLHDVRAYHFESKSRINSVHGWEHQIIMDRWHQPDTDPFMPDAGSKMINLQRKLRDLTNKLNNNLDS